MIIPFFLEKFEYDLYANLSLIEVLENQEEDLDKFIIQSFSHLINVHHIWNSRLIGTKAQSGENDLLPLSYFARFSRENYKVSIDYIEKEELNKKISYHSSEGVQLVKQDLNILYHILNHSTHHRAQIILQLNNLNLKRPDFNFIIFKSSND